MRGVPMNRLGEILEERGITQKDFAAEISIDAPLLSKICRGHINPTPTMAHRIANALNLPLERIWHLSDMEYGAYPKNATETIASAEYYASVVCHIPTGKENAISRQDLSRKSRMSDRDVRERIQAARFAGHRILSLGKGYYYETDENEVFRHCQRESRRAKTILAVCRAMTRHTDKPQIEGQIRAASAREGASAARE
jgi:transcriptional regulator with XRE-family HTH domain